MDEIEKHEKNVEKVVANFGKRALEPVAHALATLAAAVLCILRWVARRAASQGGVAPALPGQSAAIVNAKIEAATYMAETRTDAAQKSLRHYLGLDRDRPFDADCNAEIDAIVEDIVAAAVASAEARLLGMGLPQAAPAPEATEPEAPPGDALHYGVRETSISLRAACKAKQGRVTKNREAVRCPDCLVILADLEADYQARLAEARGPVGEDPTGDAATLRRAVELARRAITMAQGELGDVETLTRAETSLRIGAALARLREADAALAAASAPSAPAAPAAPGSEWTFEVTALDDDAAGLQLQAIGEAAWAAVCAPNGAFFKAWESGTGPRPRLLVRLAGEIPGPVSLELPADAQAVHNLLRTHDGSVGRPAVPDAPPGSPLRCPSTAPVGSYRAGERCRFYITHPSSHAAADAPGLPGSSWPQDLLQELVLGAAAHLEPIATYPAVGVANKLRRFAVAPAGIPWKAILRDVLRACDDEQITLPAVLVDRMRARLAEEDAS